MDLVLQKPDCKGSLQNGGDLNLYIDNGAISSNKYLCINNIIAPAVMTKTLLMEQTPQL